jgi:thiamine kinase-like enzyme
VPGLERGEPPRAVSRLEGGSVNEVFRVDSACGRFVLRLNGAHWRRPGVERDRELLLHGAAAAAGIAPDIVHAEPQAQGLLITQFQQGTRWCERDYEDAAALRRLGERLQALHALAAPDIPDFDPWSVAQDYARRIEQTSSGALNAPEPLQALGRLQRACAALDPGLRTAAIVHGDLDQNNLLDGSRLWLLDWEYAQRSDPLMDLACVLAYYPAAQRHVADLAAAAGLGPQAQGEALLQRVYIYRALSWLWHLARGEPARAP